MPGSGTFQPVVDLPMNGCCQVQTSHWMLVWLLYAHELPLRMPRWIGGS